MVKARTFISGALMALWIAMLVPQIVVLDTAFGNPPGTFSGVSLMRGAVLLFLELPGFLSLGAVCGVFRSSCYAGHFLAGDTAQSTLMLVSNAAAYLTITYWIARRILISAAKATNLQIVMLAAGVCALLANGILTVWMIWANKPYYAHSFPGLSIASLVVALITFFSLFWGARYWIVVTQN